LGEQDAAVVKAVQQQLKKRGIGVEVNGLFDARMKSSVMAFQALSRDSKGNPLVIDGVIGPVSWAILFKETPVAVVTAPSALLQKAIDTARGEIGKMEDPPGSNKGPEVEKYLRSIGLGGGYAWCAAFVYWCFREAAVSLGAVTPLMKSGGCMNHWRGTKGRRITCAEATADPSLVKPGFIFIINHGGGKGHTGIVAKVEGPFIGTVEGNSNTAGSREGLGVFELTRKINTISAGFIDYSAF
jgi:hypothetical protein